jgi:hypothetical protein
MANELFITEWFSKEMLLAGESLIKRLDDTDAKVYAAFWLLNSEDKIWKLTIVSPLVETEGTRNYYKRISNIYKSVNQNEEIIALHDINVSDTDNRIVKALKNSVLGNAILGNNRLGKNIISGIYIEDMYLYRMDWALLNSVKNQNNTNTISSIGHQINTI